MVCPSQMELPKSVDSPTKYGTRRPIMTCVMIFAITIHVQSGTVPTDARRDAAFTGVQPQARNDADSFAEAEAHTCYLARPTLS